MTDTVAETCIVCLADLGDDASNILHSTSEDDNIEAAYKDGISKKELFLLGQIDGQAPELIAHLLPCGHNLHDDCLKPWVERANSCPICRQSFNQVELSVNVGGKVPQTINMVSNVLIVLHCPGPIISSYAVADRTQVADVDPSMLIEELDDDLDSLPCPVCGLDDDEDEILPCDGCDTGYHTHCVGLEEIPVGHWFCETCATQRVIESVCPPRSNTRRSHNASDGRTRGQQRRLRHRHEASSSNWARVWQSVWDRLNLDLDFPFDDGPNLAHMSREQRAESQQRDFRQWERRFQVAERQGGANRFRETAPVLLELRTRRSKPQTSEQPESQEELRAWNALEKAKEIEADPLPRRKRKSPTASPSDTDPLPQPERRLKRPRTRRAQDLVESSSDVGAGPVNLRRRSSRNVTPPTHARPAAAPTVNGSGPSFLQSLLREVETSAAPDESRGRTRRPSLNPMAYPSPRSSRGASPTSSNYASPRALSATPPPFLSSRPGSPGLTSRVEPIFPAPQYSPSSPSIGESALPLRIPFETPFGNHDWNHAASRSHGSPASSSPRSADASPTRINMSLSAKSDVQKMVTAALKPHYQRNAVNKDQYTDINRNVSRMLYERIGEDLNLTISAKETWAKLAVDEVAKAVALLPPTS